MKKYILIIFIALFFGGLMVRAAALPVFRPIQGGTGVSTTVAGSVGQNLYVVSVNASGTPTYGFQANGGVGGGSTSTINGVIGPDFIFATSGASGLFIVSSSPATFTWRVATATASVSGFLQPADFTTFNNKQGSVTFATGTSGNDFNISSSSNTFTFNIPDAGATARGLVTTGNQSFAGEKIFNATLQTLGNFIASLSGEMLFGPSAEGGGITSASNGVALKIGGISASSAVSIGVNDTGIFANSAIFNILPLTADRVFGFPDISGNLLVGTSTIGSLGKWTAANTLQSAVANIDFQSPVTLTGTAPIFIASSSPTWTFSLGIDAVSSTRQILAGSNLLGGGTLAADRTLWWNASVSTATIATVSSTLANLINVSSTNIFATNATTTNLAVTSIASGNCVQAGAGGLLASAGAACGTGGGSATSSFTRDDANGVVKFTTSTDDLILGAGTVSSSTLTVVGSSTIRSITDSNVNALLNLRNAAGSSTAQFFATTTNNIVLQLNGHWSSTSTAPTITSGCGTSPSVDGTDVAGFLNVGGGGVASTCTLTFANQWNSNPVCFSNDTTQVLLTRAVSTTSTLVIDVAVAFGANDIIGYACLPPPR